MKNFHGLLNSTAVNISPDLVKYSIICLPEVLSDSLHDSHFIRVWEKDVHVALDLTRHKCDRSVKNATWARDLHSWSHGAAFWKPRGGWQEL